MKRLFVIIVLMLAMLLPAVSFAAIGTCTVTEDKIIVQGQSQGQYTKKTFTLACTGGTGAEAGTVSNVTLSSNTVKGWYLMGAETNPGDAIPLTDNYDIVINDADGVDLSDGLLMNRDTSTSELVNLGMSSYAFLPITGNLTIIHTNQIVESATWTLRLVLSSE